MNIRPEPELRLRTTLGSGGTALLEAGVEDLKDLEKLEGVLATAGGRPFVLGLGSNILALEGALPLVLLQLEPQRRVTLLRETPAQVTIRVWGGDPLPWLLGWAQRNGLSGMEQMVGIPGSVGGALAMNAGSYGKSMSDVVERVQLFSPEHGLRWIEPGQWRAGYRSFTVPGETGPWWMATAVEMRLARSDRALIGQVMRDTYLRKKSTQPVLARTCGCLFKNPAPDLAAWRILADCGLRGKRIGDMALSDMHCNFLVNLGRGTGSEALELVQMARERVREDQGLDLQLEVKVVQ